jgi:hypothetical protein
LLKPSSSESVLWLGEGHPPALLAAHLLEYGLTLVREPRAFDPQFDGVLPARRIAVLDELAPRATGRLSLGGRRIALVHPDPHSAEALSLSLTARGAQVVALSHQRESFQRAEQLDPDIVLIEPDHFYGECWSIVEALWEHPRLRWASLLLIHPESLGFGGVSVPDVRLLCAGIQSLSIDVDRLEEPMRNEPSFDLHLDRLGPARTLRLLVESERSLRAEFWTPEATIDIDVAKELVIGARGVRHTEPPQRVHGPAALAILLELEQGVVSVREVSHPAVANVMAPFDAALHFAGEAAVQAETELPTRPQLVDQPFDDIPTRQWDEPLPQLADEASHSSFETLDVTVANEPSPVAAISAPVHMSSLEPSGDYKTDPRAPVDTAPFRAQQKLWRAITGGAAGVAAALLLGWALWPSSEREPPLSMREADRAPQAAAAAAAPHPEPAVHGPSASTPRLESSAQVQPPAPAPAIEAPQTEASDDDEVDEEPPAGSMRAKALRANALAENGNYLRSHGFLTEARGKYVEALELYSECPRALAGMAKLSIAQGQAEQAVDYAVQLVGLRPGQGAYHLLLGDAYKAAGITDKARTAWRVAARLGNAKARSRLGD